MQGEQRVLVARVFSILSVPWNCQHRPAAPGLSCDGPFFQMLVCLATSSFCGRHPQPSLAAICSSYTGPSQCLQYLVYLQTYLEPCTGVLPTATSCVQRSRQHVWLHSLAWTRHEQAVVRDFPALHQQIHRCPRLQAASLFYLATSTRVTEKNSLTELATILRPFGRYKGARACSRIAKSCVRNFVQARCAC